MSIGDGSQEKKFSPDAPLALARHVTRNPGCGTLLFTTSLFVLYVLYIYHVGAAPGGDAADAMSYMHD